MPYNAEILNGPWREEWQSMPEFELKDMRPHRSLTIHFTCDEDVERFANILGVKITPKQKFYWFSKREPKTGNTKIWIDEENL